MRVGLLGKSAIVALALAALITVGSLPSAQAGMGGAPAYNWTGFYAGINMGYGFGGDNSVELSPGSANTVPVFAAGGVATPVDVSPSGFIGGGQVGYNYMINQFLLVGFETDLQFSDMDDSVTETAFVPGSGFARERTRAWQALNWLGTSRLRLGVTPVDCLLLYTTGGLAYGETDMGARIGFPGIGQAIVGSDSTTGVGWTIGGGVEWAFLQNWSIKTEYLYYDLGSETVDMRMVTPFAAQTSADFDNTGNLVRVGLNYKFW